MLSTFMGHEINLGYGKLLVRKISLLGPLSELRPHLCEQPRVLLRQPIKVSLRSHVGITESVLDGRRGADVLVEELLSRLLRNGFGRHDGPERRDRLTERERDG